MQDQPMTLRGEIDGYEVVDGLLEIYVGALFYFNFFFSSRRRHTRSLCDWSSDVCSSDLEEAVDGRGGVGGVQRREHEVAGEGGLDGDPGGFGVAHLPDQDHIGVLAEDRPEPRSEERRVGKEGRSRW